MGFGEFLPRPGLSAAGEKNKAQDAGMPFRVPLHLASLFVSVLTGAI
jgi:hypothetical protein